MMRRNSNRIPIELNDLMLFEERSGVIRRKLRELIPEELTMSTYKHKFDYLLYLEELNVTKEFQKYTKTDAILERKPCNQEVSFVFTLGFEGLHELRPSILAGDRVEVTCNQTAEVFNGVVKRTLLDTMEIKFNEVFASQFDEDMTFSVEFMFSHSIFTKMHMGVDRAVNRLGENFLFSNKIAIANSVLLDVQLDNGELKMGDTSIPWFKQDLDDSQKAAIVQALRAEFRPLPNIIYGPPGTGKTSTLIEVILHVFTRMKGSRILVAAHSNSAANLILARLLEYDFVKGDIMRMLSMSYQKKKDIPEELRPYCATMQTSTDDEQKELKTDVEIGVQIFSKVSLMAPYRIVVGTCVGVGPLMFDREECIPAYTHVIVDEASQCSEPEVMIPISLLARKNGSVVLAGDPKQMPPLVLCKFAKKRGLSVSFLERLVDRIEKKLKLKDVDNHLDAHLISKLLYNYRSLPSILDYYNSHFYSNELKATISETDSPEAIVLAKVQQMIPENKERNLKHAIFFHNVKGINRQVKESNSWCNGEEIEAIMTFIPEALKLGFANDDIGIITPYRLQINQLRVHFTSEQLSILVGSIEEFQGLERKIILVSTVRSDKIGVELDILRKLGVVACPKRINVAISRARAVVVVFGRADLLKRDKYWGALIKDCKDNGTFYES